MFMNSKKLSKVLLGITILGLILGLNCQLQDSCAKTFWLDHDLLFLTGPPTYRYDDVPQPEEIGLYYLNTETWEIIHLDSDVQPLRLNALSPDGEHLAVFSDRALCLLDMQWQIEFQ